MNGRLGMSGARYDRRSELTDGRLPLFPADPEPVPAGRTRYRSGFGRWYERASVRRSPRRLLRDVDEHQVYFPPELVPAATHPLVAERGADAVRSVLVQRLHQYLQFTVELETNAVVPVTSQIAHRRSGLDLPEAMYSDALKIATDEAWHAQFSYDLVMQVAAATGVQPRFTEPPAFTERLAEIRERLDPGLRRMPDLLFAVVSETLISAILSGLPHDERLPTAVRDAIADHAEDEGKHHAYFRSLLGFLWPALDPAQRRELGPWVPRLIWTFLEPDYRATGHSLVAVGLRPAEVEQVLQEAHPLEAVQRAVAGAAGATVRYFREVGALDDPGTRDAFNAAGLLDGE